MDNELLHYAQVVLMIEASDLNTQENRASSWKSLVIPFSQMNGKEFSKGWQDSVILCHFWKNKALIFIWKLAKSLVLVLKSSILHDMDVQY